MGWAESDQGGTGRCRNHPNHTQSEGVCSSCLTEKLAKISPVNRIVAGGVTGGGSCSSSGTNSPPESSPAGQGRHQRNASEVMGSISFMVSVSDGLKKSRSVAYVARSRVGEGKGAQKKGGFWAKLLRSTAKRNKEVLIHQRSRMREETVE